MEYNVSDHVVTDTERDMPHLIFAFYLALIIRKVQNMRAYIVRGLN